MILQMIEILNARLLRGQGHSLVQEHEGLAAKDDGLTPASR